MPVEEVITKLKEKGLKVTPQRIAIYEAIIKLNNHPTAENIIEYIRINHPHISVATVYKILDTLAANRLINKVKTESDYMRYDVVMKCHHHIYYSDSDIIEDYNNDDLSKMLKEFFMKNTISGFKIEDIKLQITGKYTDSKE